MIIFMDSDGSTDTSEVLRVISCFNDPSCSVVCGIRDSSRYMDSMIRRITSMLFAKFAMYFGKTKVSDTQCGFKGFRRESAFEIFKRIHIKGWAFDVEALYIAEKLHMNIKTVRIKWIEKSGSKLKVGPDSIKMLLDMVLMRLTYATGVWKV